MAASPDIESYDRRLFPQIVDARARSGYERPFGLYPRTADPCDGFRAVNYAQLANAINRAAWWLDEALGEAGNEVCTFAYFGPTDLRYVVFVLAGMKTGRKVLIASLRNTVDAQLSLFRKANCGVVVSCSSQAQLLQPLFTALGDNTRNIQAPSLDELLAQDEVAHYAFDKTFDEVADTVFVVLHTSGSSGSPKPINWTFRFLCAVDCGRLLPTDQGPYLTRTYVDHQNLLLLLPCFHAGGLLTHFYAGFYNMTLVLGHPAVPMSAGYVTKLLKEDVITAMLTPPSILEDVSKYPEGLNELAKVKHIGYAGGPLHPSVGNAIAPKMQHLFSFIGASEYGWYHCVQGGNEYWNALKFVTGIGYHFDEVSEGIFELVIVKDSETVKFHGIFETFPHLQEYRTRDLYTRLVPGSGWWYYKGRADDLIVLSNGEKVNPIPLEDLIRTHPKVKAALVVGEYRFSPSLLLELDAQDIPQTAEAKQRTLDEIWPIVQQANKIAPTFSKIPKSLILFAPADKPFMRAGKGTVQRQNTVKLFSQELDELFAWQQTSLLTEGLSLATPISPSIIRAFTKEVYLQALEMKGLKAVSDVNDSEDIFERGLDSLGVVVIVQRLKAALKACDADMDLNMIDSRFIYSAPSLIQISDAIIALLGKRNGASNAPENALRHSKMEALLQKYSRDMPCDNMNDNASKNLKNAPSPAGKPWKIIITGTTGSLGSHLLAAIYALPESKVSKIYCLNRSANGKEKQKKTSQSRGQNASWSDSRVEFLQVVLSLPKLGLSSEMYQQLVDEATVIIHCAWKVDFNITIETFEPQIRGVRNLLDFSFHSKNKAPLVFVSSISTALGWLAKTPDSTVPEAIIRDFDAPEKIGYGESKYISEVLIEDFTKAAGIATAVFRTGQIAGPLSKRGYWNKREWFPSIIASSKHLKVLPETLASFENIDWLPVDLLSTMMVELVEKLLDKGEHVRETLVYNLVNPQVTSWSSLLPAVQALTSIPRTIPLRLWLDELDQSVRNNHGIVTDQNPAAKLLDFFRLLSSQKEMSRVPRQLFEVTKLVRDSKQAAQLGAVSPDWVKLWMEQWKF